MQQKVRSLSKVLQHTSSASQHSSDGVQSSPEGTHGRTQVEVVLSQRKPAQQSQSFLSQAPFSAWQQTDAAPQAFTPQSALPVRSRSQQSLAASQESRGLPQQTLSEPLAAVKSQM